MSSRHSPRLRRACTASCWGSSSVPGRQCRSMAVCRSNWTLVSACPYRCPSLAIVCRRAWPAFSRAPRFPRGAPSRRAAVILGTVAVRRQTPDRNADGLRRGRPNWSSGGQTHTTTRPQTPPAHARKYQAVDDARMRYVAMRTVPVVRPVTWRAVMAKTCDMRVLFAPRVSSTLMLTNGQSAAISAKSGNSRAGVVGRTRYTHGKAVRFRLLYC